MLTRMEALQQTFQPAHLNSGSSRLSHDPHEAVIHSPFSGEGQIAQQQQEEEEAIEAAVQDAAHQE